MTDPEIIASRVEYIWEQMKKQGLKGNPRRYVVLFGWNRIRDWDRDYELIVPPLPSPISSRMRLWTIERHDSPELVEVKLIEERIEGLWVGHLDKNVQFLAHRDDIKTLPVPFRPLAVKRSELSQWIGEAQAEAFIQRRMERLNASSN